MVVVVVVVVVVAVVVAVAVAVAQEENRLCLLHCSTCDSVSNYLTLKGLTIRIISISNKVNPCNKLMSIFPYFQEFMKL